MIKRKKQLGSMIGGSIGLATGLISGIARQKQAKKMEEEYNNKLLGASEDYADSRTNPNYFGDRDSTIAQTGGLHPFKRKKEGLLEKNIKESGKIAKKNKDYTQKYINVLSAVERKQQGGILSKEEFTDKYNSGKISADEVISYNLKNNTNHKQYFYQGDKLNNRRSELAKQYGLNASDPNKGKVYDEYEGKWKTPNYNNGFKGTVETTEAKPVPNSSGFRKFAKNSKIKSAPKFDIGEPGALPSDRLNRPNIRKDETVDNAKNKKFEAPGSSLLEIASGYVNAGKRAAGKFLEKEQDAPLLAPEKPKENTYKVNRLEDDASGKIAGYSNRFSNDEGFDYIATPKMKELPSDTLYKESQQVAHFLMDSDITDNQKYTSPYTDLKGTRVSSGVPGKFIAHGRNQNPEDYVPLYKKKNDKNYYNVKYAKVKDLPKYANSGYESNMGLRQHKFSDIDWEGKGKQWEYATNVKYLPTKDGGSTSIVGEKKDNYSRYSGGSGVYIFKNKDGKEEVVDVGGSINDIKAIGQKLIDEEGIDPKELTFGYYDMGSYSAKPYGGDKGVSTKQYRNYNTYNKGYSGGALHIPRQKKQTGGSLLNPQGNTEPISSTSQEIKGKFHSDGGTPMQVGGEVAELEKDEILFKLPDGSDYVFSRVLPSVEKGKNFADEAKEIESTKGKLEKKLAKSKNKNPILEENIELLNTATQQLAQKQEQFKQSTGLDKVEYMPELEQNKDYNQDGIHDAITNNMNMAQMGYKKRKQAGGFLDFVNKNENTIKSIGNSVGQIADKATQAVMPGVGGAMTQTASGVSNVGNMANGLLQKPMMQIGGNPVLDIGNTIVGAAFPSQQKVDMLRSQNENFVNPYQQQMANNYAGGQMMSMGGMKKYQMGAINYGLNNAANEMLSQQNPVTPVQGKYKKAQELGVDLMGLSKQDKRQANRISRKLLRDDKKLDGYLTRSGILDDYTESINKGGEGIDRAFDVRFDSRPSNMGIGGQRAALKSKSYMPEDKMYMPRTKRKKK